MFSDDQAVIDLDEGVSIWGVPSGLEVDSFVHEVYVLLIAICLPTTKSTSHFHLYSHAGCACLLLAGVRFPGQLLRSRLPLPTSRQDLGRLRMPAQAVYKSFVGACLSMRE
jgi:hypothetical protein